MDVNITQDADMGLNVPCGVLVRMIWTLSGYFADPISLVGINFCMVEC